MIQPFIFQAFVHLLLRQVKISFILSHPSNILIRSCTCLHNCDHTCMFTHELVQCAYIFILIQHFVLELIVLFFGFLCISLILPKQSQINLLQLFLILYLFQSRLISLIQLYSSFPETALSSGFVFLSLELDPSFSGSRVLIYFFVNMEHFFQQLPGNECVRHQLFSDFIFLKDGLHGIRNSRWKIKFRIFENFDKCNQIQNFEGIALF